MNIWKRRVTKRRLLPQRLALPSAREAHGGDVDGRVSGEQGIDLRLHVVVGRNDVEEILDDAKAFAFMSLLGEMMLRKYLMMQRLK